MKKLFTMVTLVLVMSQTMFGQKTLSNVEMKWGKEFKESKKTTLVDIIGHDNNSIYALKQRIGFFAGGKRYLDQFDKNMNLVNSMELELEYQGKELYPDFIIFFNNKLYLFSLFVNKSQKKNYLFVSSINMKTLKINNDLKKIAEISYSGFSRYNTGEFDYDISRDTSKLLIYYNLPYNKGEKERFGFHVYDIDLNLLWERDVALPYKEELFAIEDYKVDNNGNTYIQGRLYKDVKKVKRKGKPNFIYQLIAYSNEGKIQTEYPIRLPNLFITDMSFDIAENNDIICGGFYSEEGTFSIKGCYFLTVDGETKKITSKSLKEFSVTFITQNMKERTASKTKKKAQKGKSVELYDYDLGDFVLRSDGGVVLIGEQYKYYYRTTTTTTNGSTSTRTTHHFLYNDIIIINIDPNGEIEWATKIPKEQHTINDWGLNSSYALAVVDDKLFFIFNDNPKNLYYKGTGAVQRYTGRKNSIVTVVEVDNDGKKNRAALYKTSDFTVATRPKVCEQISNNEMIIFGQKKKTQQFGKATFDK